MRPENVRSESRLMFGGRVSPSPRLLFVAALSRVLVVKLESLLPLRECVRVDPSEADPFRL